MAPSGLAPRPEAEKPSSLAEVERLAAFVAHADYEDLSPQARTELKSRVLDALGCAIGALDGEPIARIRAQLKDFGGNPLVTLFGGGRTAPDRAAFYNGALVRYLDFNDSYLSPGETCHPSDNVAPVLAAAEYAGTSGRTFLTGLAVAYQVQCRLSEVAPVRARGFDHTTQGAYAVAAGAAKALGLPPRQTANAIAIAGTANNALRVTRTGALSHWKGLAYPNTAFSATHATFLASHGVTGPLEVFEGNKGFIDTISGPFTIDWEAEGLDVVPHTILKKYNAEIHAQSALEAMLEVRDMYHLVPENIDRIELDTFDVAFNIIGGGEEGGKYRVRTKEEADHSLPYLLAAALLDGEVTPAQYAPERVNRSDVQTLLRAVVVRPDPNLSCRFPLQMPARLRVFVSGGTTITVEKADYEGFFTRPMPWDQVIAKFERLAAPYASAGLRRALAEAVLKLDSIPVSVLTELLAQVGKEDVRERATIFIHQDQPAAG